MEPGVLLSPTDGPGPLGSPAGLSLRPEELPPGPVRRVGGLPAALKAAPTAGSHPPPCTSSRIAPRSAGCGSIRRSVPVKVRPRDLGPLPAEVFSLSHFDRRGRVCKPLPWRGRGGDGGPCPEAGSVAGVGWPAVGLEAGAPSVVQLRPRPRACLQPGNRCQRREVVVSPAGSGLHCSWEDACPELPSSVGLGQGWPG